MGMGRAYFKWAGTDHNSRSRWPRYDCRFRKPDLSFKIRGKIRRKDTAHLHQACARDSRRIRSVCFSLLGWLSPLQYGRIPAPESTRGGLFEWWRFAAGGVERPAGAATRRNERSGDTSFGESGGRVG